MADSTTYRRAFGDTNPMALSTDEAKDPDSPRPRVPELPDAL